MGDPQKSLPVLHITGTNGKTSTARALSQLLISKGLSVGTFTSPHLESLNERIMANLEPIADQDLAEVLSDLAGLEPLMGGELRPTWFELITAAAFRYFADHPVDVAVIEVGMGGRWDATNIADGSVSIVTNVALDHTELLGATRADIAGEKAGIVKPGAMLVLGETDPELYRIFEAEGPEELWLAGRDWAVESNLMAVGGRSLDASHAWGRTTRGSTCRCTGATRPTTSWQLSPAPRPSSACRLEGGIVAGAAAAVRSPGRLEVVGRNPLLVLDGAKNVAGARASAVAVAEEFGEATSRVMVVGMLKGKSALEMLEALDAPQARLVVACPPPSPARSPPRTWPTPHAPWGAARWPQVRSREALELALAEAGADELVLVTGSLYVVGAARFALAVDAGGSSPARQSGR